MDKNAIKKYAVWARRELITRVMQKAEQYGITDQKTIAMDTDTISGRVLTTTEKRQRQALLSKIKQDGFSEVMEEVAYTWFNRFTALRFMEVNAYLPSHVRIFTDEEGNYKPQILTEAINLELSDLDMERVYKLKESNDDEALFKYLIIIQCNALNPILPYMFQKISDYTELLFPDNLLREGSVIQQMIELIPEDDWKDAVQIIGWLYQYYNSEKKDEVFAALKKNIKVTKENIPAATQLFTPDWIVRYMVENSLGRLWVEGHTDDELRSGWKYYLDEAKQEPEVEAKLSEIRKEYAALRPEDIKCIDPCSGSGHICAYMFDVLMQIYEAYGYTAHEAVRSIIEHNIYGLDIDERAAQLTYFAVMMKARQYDRRFLARKDENGDPDVPQPHVYAIEESNNIDPHALEYFVNGDQDLKVSMDSIIKDLHDAKEYGSILNVNLVDFDAIYARIDEIKEDVNLSKDYVLEHILPLIDVAHALSQKYDVVVTNPPYMGSGNMDPKLSEFVKKHYPDSKSDLFACFIEKGNNMVSKGRFNCMVTMQSWMFLSSFEKLRASILKTKDIVTLMHMENMVLGIAFGTAVTVFRNYHCNGFKGTYNQIKLCDIKEDKPVAFPVPENRFAQVSTDNFSKIPGSPVAYWVSSIIYNDFAEGIPLGKYCPTKKGLDTGENDKFLRFWFEISKDIFGVGFKDSVSFSEAKMKWAPHDKGGDYRRWYGNKEWVVNWENNGFELHNSRANLRSEQYYFCYSITWSSLSSGKVSFRLSDYGGISNTAGSSLYPNEKESYYLLSLLNSVVAQYLLDIISPTLNYSAGPVSEIPVIFCCDKISIIINKLSLENVFMAKYNWDSYETSWDFKKHPIVPQARELAEQQNSQFCGSRMEKFGLISWHYDRWKEECEDRFIKLKGNEEELNSIFIDIYGLENELEPSVDDKDVTVHRIFDTKDDVPESMKGSNYVRTKRDEIVSLISYAVGCMFGRYTIYEEGLFYAGGFWQYGNKVELLSDLAERSGLERWVPSELFLPDQDNVIPITDDEYFNDDIVGKFVRFIEVVYGSDTLEENLKFIADALGGKGTPREVIRSYFLNDFYNDHCRTYQKRPIYWMFDSGKKGGFKCLIYMHRYQPDTIARIRTDYVHEQQSRYDTAIEDIEKRLQKASGSDRVRLSKQLKKLRDQAEEIRDYEEKIHHLADQMISIDLDDGVKHNYEIFKDVLAKIK